MFCRQLCTPFRRFCYHFLNRIQNCSPIISCEVFSSVQRADAMIPGKHSLPKSMALLAVPQLGRYGTSPLLISADQLKVCKTAVDHFYFKLHGEKTWIIKVWAMPYLLVAFTVCDRKPHHPESTECHTNLFADP